MWACSFVDLAVFGLFLTPDRNTRHVVEVDTRARRTNLHFNADPPNLYPIPTRLFDPVSTGRPAESFKTVAKTTFERLGNLKELYVASWEDRFASSPLQHGSICLRACVCTDV